MSDEPIAEGGSTWRYEEYVIESYWRDPGYAGSEE